MSLFSISLVAALALTLMVGEERFHVFLLLPKYSMLLGFGVLQRIVEPERLCRNPLFDMV